MYNVFGSLPYRSASKYASASLSAESDEMKLSLSLLRMIWLAASLIMVIFLLMTKLLSWRNFQSPTKETSLRDVLRVFIAVAKFLLKPLWQLDKIMADNSMRSLEIIIKIRNFYGGYSRSYFWATTFLRHLVKIAFMKTVLKTLWILMKMRMLITWK